MPHNHRVGKAPTGEAPTKLEQDFRQQEEGHYFLHNHDLLVRIRARLDRQDRKAELADASGIDDDALLGQLADHGLDRDTLQTLHLIPALAVAWADREIQPKERALLTAAADARKLTGAARAIFDGYLLKAPKKKLVDTAMDFCTALLKAHTPDVEHAIDDLSTLAVRVADAAGGVLHFFGRVDEEEQAVLLQIAEHLAEERPEAAGKIIAAL